MIVICLEGCHGCGKTELCQRFMQAGFQILDEAFLDMPEYMLHPQSLLMETTWVCAWFKRILKRADELKNEGRNAIFIADRSPFSAVFYAANKTGSLLEPVIRAHMKEVREAAGIEVYTVYLQVERELLWSRIMDRLKREPGRVKYREDKREWMESTLQFYDNFKWDMCAQNNDITLTQLRDGLIQRLSCRSPRFQETLMDPAAMFSEAARAACQSPPAPAVEELPAAASSPASGAGDGAGAGAFHPVESRAQRKLVAAVEDVTLAVENDAEDAGAAPADATTSGTDADAPSPRVPAVKRKAPCSPTSPDTVLDLAMSRGSRRTGADVTPMQSLDSPITEVQVA